MNGNPVMRTGADHTAASPLVGMTAIIRFSWPGKPVESER